MNLIFGRSPYFHIEFFYFFRKPIYFKYFNEIGTQKKVEGRRTSRATDYVGKLIAFVVHR